MSSTALVLFQDQEKILPTSEQMLPFFPANLFHKPCTLREMPFDPWVVPGGGDITLSFLKEMIALPKEVRVIIYGYIACQGGPDYHNETLHRNRNAGGNSFKLYLPTYKKPAAAKLTESDEENSIAAPIDLDFYSVYRAHLCNTWWGRRGLFRCFEGHPYEYPHHHENILRYAYAIATTEELNIDENGTWVSRDGYIDTGALRDVTYWFWTETVLELGYGSMTWLSKGYHKCFQNIQNISIEIRPQWDDPPNGIWPDGERIVQRTVQLVHKINIAFPNIQNLTVWATLTIPEIADALYDPFPKPWVAALKRVVVGNKFDFELLAAFDDPYNPYMGPPLSEERKKRLEMWWENNLRFVCMPELDLD